MNHDVYLLLAFLTHAVVGYSVVRGLTDAPPVVGVAGALTPDVDLYVGPVFGFSVVHRGVLHTPAALVVLTGIVLLVGTLVWRHPSDAPRRVAAAFGIGFLTHLVVDSSTNLGIMWLYPASTARVSLGVPIHGAWGTAALWGASVAFVLLGSRLERRVRDDGRRTSPERR